MMIRPPVALRLAALALAACAGGSACAGPVQTRPLPRFDADSIRATLEFLAGDPRMGRDTPSAGLREVEEHIARRFEEAGLEPLAGDSWFLPYTAKGLSFDAAALAVRVESDGEAIELQPGRDVRLLSVSRAIRFDGDIEISPIDAFGARTGRDARRDEPVLVLVDEASPLWTGCEGPHEILSRGVRGRRRPAVLLIRAGIVPPGEARVRVELPEPTPVDLTLRNVAAVRPGSSRPDEIVMFTAHHDHLGVGVPKDGDAIWNGADDDASGTAAVVHLAEAFAALDPAPARSVAFVCFSGEEKGFLGSRAFCADPPIEPGRIVALVNIEMIGRPPGGVDGRAWITGPGYSDLLDHLAPGFGRARVEITDFPMQDRLFFASDNLPFARKGVVAHSVSAGSLHADYHGKDDEVDRIHVDHMARVIQALFEAGRDLATGEMRPRWTDAGRAALGFDEEEDGG